MTANALTAAILARVSHDYVGECLLFRLNVIATKTMKGFVRSAPPGASDIIGCVRGIPAAIEVKIGKDKMSLFQVGFSAAWRRAGGVYIIARDLETCMADLAAEVERTRI